MNKYYETLNTIHFSENNGSFSHTLMERMKLHLPLYLPFNIVCRFYLYTHTLINDSAYCLKIVDLLYTRL